jgi:DNA-binding response OmpR family regulator
MTDDSARTPLRVLVVDDCPDTTASLAMLLHLWGYDVCVASNGPGALEAAGSRRPDVVLLDIGLPGMDGYEVARRLRREHDLAGALILTLSGYGREADRCRAWEAGCDHHLVKPVDPEELHGLLEARARSPKPGDAGRAGHGPERLSAPAPLSPLGEQGPG